MNMIINYCPNCGKRVEHENAIFCSYCGTELPKIENIPTNMNERLEQYIELRDHILPDLERKYIELMERDKLLDSITEKWVDIDISQKVIDISIDLSIPIFDLLNNMWKDVGFMGNKEAWAGLGEFTASIILPCIKKCYYLGCEITLGNYDRNITIPLTETAFFPLEDFVRDVTKQGFKNGKITEVKEKYYLQEIKELGRQIGGELVILGIKKENYFE